MSKCVISFSSKGREDYNKALLRNIDETKKYYDGDFLYYSLDHELTEYKGVKIHKGLPKDCKPHKTVPYQFKPKLFKEAFDKGYQQILWMDSTIVPMANLNPIFKKMSKDGVVAFHNIGHDLPKWISDVAVRNLELDLFEEPYQIMACVIGFDLSTKKGKRIFDKWLALSEDGQSFQDNKGSWEGFVAHRHDQAILSGLLWKEKHKLLPYGNLVYEPHDKDKFNDYKIYFINKAV